MKNLIVFIGESGSGKNFLIEHLNYHFPRDFHVVPQVTTRPMREGESEGNPYHFVKRYQFLDMLYKHELLEWKTFKDWYYGTAKNDLVDNKINILSANPAAARELLHNPDLNTHIVYIHCNDKQRLIRSLEREANPDIPEIFRRYEADLKDFAPDKLDFGFYYIENNNMQDIYKFEKIVERELKRFWAKVDN